MNAGTKLVSSFVKAANTLGIFGLIGALVFVGLELRQQRSALADFTPPSEAVVRTLAEREVMLDCELERRAYELDVQVSHKILINTFEFTAKFANHREIRTGELKVEGNTYVLHFPKTEIRHEEVVTVNRYTGETKWEFGKPPFGEFNSDNIIYNGACTRGDSAVMF